eukprot:350653-Chlamydomonas_euryale.AAC.1
MCSWDRTVRVVLPPTLSQPPSRDCRPPAYFRTCVPALACTATATAGAFRRFPAFRLLPHHWQPG